VKTKEKSHEENRLELFNLHLHRNTHTFYFWPFATEKSNLISFTPHFISIILLWLFVIILFHLVFSISDKFFFSFPFNIRLTNKKKIKHGRILDNTDMFYLKTICVVNLVFRFSWMNGWIKEKLSFLVWFQVVKGN
jgi:hypothetical protein